MKLLLVDDDIFLRDMYSRKFSDSGFEVMTVEDGRSALSVLQKVDDFDVILLDMVMPGMSGSELIGAIRTQFPEMKAKCIVLSNQGRAEDIDEAKRLGAVGYIVKAETIPSEAVKKVIGMLSK